jgi:hypothetical protein
VIVLVAHNELGHEPEEVEGEDGEVVARCPLYPGVTCREHLNIAVDIDIARQEDLPKVPFIELHPNSWLVLPTAEVRPIPEEDQFVVKEIRKRVADVQEELGAALSPAQYRKIADIFHAASTAYDEEQWALALQRLAKIADVVYEPAAPLRGLVEARLAALDEDVLFAFEDIAEDDDRPLEERVIAVRVLWKAVDVDVLGKRLAACDAMEAWLKEHGAL